MISEPSALSLSAAALYAGVVIVCLLAMAAARPGAAPRWNRFAWAALAFLFAVLVLLRVFGIEEGARDVLREAMRAGGRYEDRREIQNIAAAIAFGGVAIAVTALAYRHRRAMWLRGRRNRAVSIALLASAALLFLMVLRLISFHAIDALLYGPIKLNWFVDIGASLTVAAAAVYYVHRMRSVR